MGASHWSYSVEYDTWSFDTYAEAIASTVANGVDENIDLREYCNDCGEKLFNGCHWDTCKHVHSWKSVPMNFWLRSRNKNATAYKFCTGCLVEEWV